MFAMQQLAELQILYPEYKKLVFEELLKGISSDTLQRISTYLIGMNLYSEKDIDNGEIINGWFSQDNLVFGQQFYERLKNYEDNNKKKLIIIHTISCLKILQYGLELEEQGLLNTKSKQQSEIDILFALLICNQNEDYNQTKDKKKIQEMFPKHFGAALLLNYSFPVSDIINFYFADYTYCQIIKTLLLFRFLDSDSKGLVLLNRFCDYFDIINWKEYLERVIPIISAWSKRNKPSSVDIILEKNNIYEANYAFLQKLAMNNYIQLEDVDYKKLREKPLLELDKTTFRVIHPLFISDKIYKGLYFLLNQLNSSEPKIIKAFRPWYTSNYSESVCFQQLIKYSIEKFDVRFFDNELNALGIVGPPDCYLRLENDIFLFENKDILVNARIKSSYDFEALINEIKKKLVFDNEKPVGIGQLITNIKKLLKKENKFDEGFNPDSTFIYPILVVHDNMYDTIGLNRILGVFFYTELMKLKTEGLDVSRIKPLVLMNIDTLIQISDILKADKYSLKESFEVFYKNFKLPKGRPLEEKDYAKTLIPFSNIIMEYLNDKLGRDWRYEKLFKYFFEKANENS